MKYIIEPIGRFLLAILIYTFKYLVIPLVRLVGIFLIYIYYLDINEVKKFIDDLYYIDSTENNVLNINIYTKSMFHYTPTFLFANVSPFYYKNIFSFLLKKKRYYKKVIFNDADTVNLTDTYIHPEIFEETKEKYNWNNVELKN